MIFFEKNEPRPKEWQKCHPEGTKAECERELKLSRHTVLKWWDVKGQGEADTP